jgi:Ca-activated chloride channel homolog
MNWAAPFVLGLVPLSLFLVWWLFRPLRGAVSASSFANIRRLWADRQGLSDSPAARRRLTRGLLLAVGAALALCALARPQWGKVEETTYDQSREVLLALDLSRSMLADDVSPTRLDRAKLLIDSLLDQLRGERVGLVVFAGTSFLQSPLSADYEVLRDFLRDLDPSYLPQGGTEYGAMLRTSLNAFGEQGGGDRFLVVLSDGEAQDEEWKSFLPSLQEKGVRVVGLGVGTAAGALVPDGSGGVTKDESGAAVLSRLEPATLQELATASGGAYRDASTWVDIAEVVQSTVDQGRAGAYVERKESRLQDRFQWFLAPALLFLLLSFWLELPVVPVPRTLRQRTQKFAPVRVAASATMMLLLISPALSRAAVEPEAPANPLGALVEQLATAPAPLEAADYERLASTTIEVASKPESLPPPSRLGVIDDALRGVDEGEQLDAKAADWPKLRQELQRLREQQKKQDQQQQEQEQQNQQQDQAQNSQQENAQDDTQPADQNDASDKQSAEQNKPGDQQPADQNNSDDQQAADQNSADDQQAADQNSPDDQQAAAENAGRAGRPRPAAEPAEDKPQDPKDKNQHAEQPKDEPQPLHDDKAGFGKLDEQPETQPQDQEAKAAEPSEKDDAEQPEPATRLVGGGPVQQQPADGENLALVEALDRMERIKDGDSPSTLFDRMNRAEGAPPQKKNAKNW